LYHMSTEGVYLELFVFHGNFTWGGVGSDRMRTSSRLVNDRTVGSYLDHTKKYMICQAGISMYQFRSLMDQRLRKEEVVDGVKVELSDVDRRGMWMPDGWEEFRLELLKEQSERACYVIINEPPRYLSGLMNQMIAFVNALLVTARLGRVRLYVNGFWRQYDDFGSRSRMEDVIDMVHLDDMMRSLGYVVEVCDGVPLDINMSPVICPLNPRINGSMSFEELCGEYDRRLGLVSVIDLGLGYGEFYHGDEIAKNVEFMGKFRYLMLGIQFHGSIRSVGDWYRDRVLGLGGDYVFLHLKMGDDTIRFYAKEYGVGEMEYVDYMVRKYRILIDYILSRVSGMRVYVATCLRPGMMAGDFLGQLYRDSRIILPFKLMAEREMNGILDYRIACGAKLAVLHSGSTFSMIIGYQVKNKVWISPDDNKVLYVDGVGEVLI